MAGRARRELEARASSGWRARRAGRRLEDLRREEVEWREVGQAWLRLTEAAQLAVRIEAVQQIRAAMKRAIQRTSAERARPRAARRPDAR